MNALKNWEFFNKRSISAIERKIENFFINNSIEQNYTAEKDILNNIIEYFQKANIHIMFDAGYDILPPEFKSLFLMIEDKNEKSPNKGERKKIILNVAIC